MAWQFSSVNIGIFARVLIELILHKKLEIPEEPF